MELAKEVGVDAMRYFLFREFVFGLDGEYSKETMYQRINADLANDFGNCINRTTNMVPKYLGSDLIDLTSTLQLDSELKSVCADSIKEYHAELTGFHYHKALEAISKIIGATNKYIENNAPWTLAKSPENNDKLKLVLLHCYESLRIATLLLVPFIPTSSEKALGYLGDSESLKDRAPLVNKAAWGKGPSKVIVTKGSPLFPRLEIPKPD